MEDKQYSGMTYLHGQWRYFVDKREDNGKFTAFMDSINSGTDDMRTEVATIPDFDTFEEAQDALDGYALKHKFTADCTTTKKEPEMEQQTFGDTPTENNDFVPPEDDPPEMEQGNDSPESGADAGESANDDAEQPQQTCDWKNASGDGDGREDSVSDGEQEPLPEGQDLSLRLPAFSSIFDDADAKLRDLSRAMKTKLIESGELSIKIVINNYGSVLKPDPKKCNVACNLKPAKVSTPIRFPDDLQITVEKDGRVIVPEDREHQLSFADGAASGGTVTVDGQTGLAEHYEGDGEDKLDDDAQPEDSEEPPQDSPEDGSGDSDGEEIEEGDQEHE